MAKSTPTKPKKPVPISTGTGLIEPEEPEPADAEVLPAPEPAPASAEPAAAAAAPAAAPAAHRPTFHETMKAIHKDDWGPRANIYLYRIEPMIDRTSRGDKKYIQCYAEPINEERLLVDHGSGKYKAILNFRKPGAEQGDIIDQYIYDLLNLNFPPKVPEGDWVDDPKNRRWAWGRKKEQATVVAPATSSGLAEAASTLETLVNISERFSEKARPPFQPQQAPAAPTAPPDPFDTAKKIMDMRTNDPMITLLLSRMEAQDKAMEEARKREFELQQKLIDAKTNTTVAAPQKGLLDQLVDLAGVSERLDPLKKLFGWNGGSNGEGRPARSTALDVVRDLGTKIFEGPVGEGLGNWLTSLTTRGTAPQPTMNGNPTSQVQRTGPDPLSVFIERTATPAMLRYFLDGSTGAAFADWMDAGFPDELVQLQSFTHPLLPGLKGVEAIVQGYMHTQRIWTQILKRGEPEFRQFITDFCAWKPEEENGILEGELVPDTPERDTQEERIS